MPTMRTAYVAHVIQHAKLAQVYFPQIAQFVQAPCFSMKILALAHVLMAFMAIPPSKHVGLVIPIARPVFHTQKYLAFPAIRNSLT